MDIENLWFRVLTARYGAERGRLRQGGRKGSLWWREVVRIQDGEGLGVGGSGSVFRRRWRTGQILSSGLIPGLEGFLCV
jgi:hypothetical protein